MLTSVVRNNLGPAAAAPWPRAGRSTLWRAGLIAACALTIGGVAWMGHPAGYLAADPALAHLLRGMALIKSLIVLGAGIAVLWRYGWPTATPVALAYAVGETVLAGSTMLIWQLTWIPLAALLFHGALIGMLCLGWRGEAFRPGRAVGGGS